ncbi:unnamed protein product [Caenorhabditis angaria]|uniref:Uncharacterized protein n=1 Tax=Caenorhabditis angaria TaxID=860376 RepID=A0A9P1N1P0_9PELO|nr:unnamed protein product [Caenorhabditis angaria]
MDSKSEHSLYNFDAIHQAVPEIDDKISGLKRKVKSDNLESTIRSLIVCENDTVAFLFKATQAKFNFEEKVIMIDMCARL